VPEGSGKAARLGPRPDAQLRVWRSSGLHPSLAHCTRGDRREERAKGREKKRTTHVELRERGGSTEGSRHIRRLMDEMSRRPQSPWRVWHN